MNATAHQRTLQNTVLLMVLLNSFSTPLMLSAVNVALPSIADDLGMGAIALSWVPTAYLMASAMFVLVFGRVSDMVGRKRIFLLGTTMVVLTSLVGAAATNVSVLLGARFLQGMSAAMLSATQVAIVSSVFPAHERGRAIGLVLAAIYGGLASGPLLGGYAIELLHWRASFLLQVPLAFAVLFIGVFKVKPEWRAPRAATFDWRGALTYGLGILLFCLGVSLLPSAASALLLVASAATIALFWRHARRHPAPLWDVGLFFNNRLFTRSCLAALLMYSATYANLVLVSLYLQYIRGLPPASTGLLMMAQPLSMALLSPFVGRLSDRVEPRLLTTLGMAVTGVGLLLLAQLAQDSSNAGVLLALIITGIGFSLFSSPNVNAIMGSVDKQNYGSAAGAVATTRIVGQLASMVLVTLSMALFLGGASLGPENFPRLERALTFSFSVAALLCVPGMALSWLRGRAHGADDTREHA